MSTATTIDAKAFLTGWLGNVSGMYAADVTAIPEDKWNATFGGCTRPASELTADALSLLVYCTRTMRGESAEGLMEELGPKCQTRESATATIKQCCSDFSAAFDACPEEQLLNVIDTPFGMTMPLFSVCQIAVNHLWYHDGQLNYIQCLLGDDKVHWMG